jgi:hypothetical protein
MERQPTSSNPSDDAIEAIIQQATSAAPYSRPGGPLRDTRTQLFVGNVLLFSSLDFWPLLCVSIASL